MSAKISNLSEIYPFASNEEKYPRVSLVHGSIPKISKGTGGLFLPCLKTL